MCQANTFRTPDKYSIYKPKSEWHSKFDCITSFFSLEHVPDPRRTLSEMSSLLKTSGIVYIIVPNVYSINRADLLVVDHLHHYSDVSMQYCLELCGFELLELDHQAHQQASVYIAKKREVRHLSLSMNRLDVSQYFHEARLISNYWQTVENNLLHFECESASQNIDKLYIYGA